MRFEPTRANQILDTLESRERMPVADSPGDVIVTPGKVRIGDDGRKMGWYACRRPTVHRDTVQELFPR
jgi:hypothetical protein